MAALKIKKQPKPIRVIEIPEARIIRSISWDGNIFRFVTQDNRILYAMKLVCHGIRDRIEVNGIVYWDKCPDKERDDVERLHTAWLKVQLAKAEALRLEMEALAPKPKFRRSKSKITFVRRIRFVAEFSKQKISFV